MGVAFELEVTRSRAEVAWRAAIAAVPITGLMLAAADFLAGPTVILDAGTELRSVAALACGLVACGVGFSASRAIGAASSSRTTRLLVDEGGGVSLRIDGAPAVPFTLRATCALPGLTLLVMAPYLPSPRGEGARRSVTLAIGRDSAARDGWRRLQVWLRWLERGRPGRPEAGSDRT